MGRRSPSRDILQVVTVLWNHPFLTGIALLMFTPPFFPLVVYFSPLLMSTALCVAALVSVGSRMEKIKAEGEGTHLDVHGMDAWVERERPDRENAATHFSAERDLQRWVNRTECEGIYRGVDGSSWTGADPELTRIWVNPARERVVEGEMVIEPQEETDEDRWNAWVKEYEARPGWGETEDNEPAAAFVTATTKPASISKPNEENPPHKEEATSLPKPENTHHPVMQVPVRKVETVGIQHDYQASIKEGVPWTSQSHVSDVQALDSIEKLRCQEMEVPRIQPIVSLPHIGVLAEVFAHLKTPGLGSNSNLQVRGLSPSPKESLPGEDTPAGSSGGCAQRDQAREKNKKLVEDYDIGAETPLLRHLKSSRFERRGRMVEYSPLPIRSSNSVGQDRNLTTSERSPRQLQKSKACGSKSSGKSLAQYAYGGATESGRIGKRVINSEVSPRLLQSLKPTGLGSSDERNYQVRHGGGHRESSIHSTPVQVSRLQGGGGDRSVTTSESAPRVSLKSAGSRISNERISQDGYGRCTANIGHRIPVATSRVERDGLENTGASSEFYSQMVLKTAAIRNLEETISQDAYGGPKQIDELRMLVQMRKPERGDVERSVTTPKCSPQKLKTSGLKSSKDNNSQGWYGGAKEISDPKMPAETLRAERIGAEKTVTASEIPPCIFPRLMTEESETSMDKVSEEAVELNVSKEVNILETCEKKHVTNLESAPRVSLKSTGTRSSDERISRDGYGHCTEDFGHRMPAPTSRVERDGLEIPGAISESSPQLVLKTAGIRNSDETNSQSRNGGFKQNNELRILAEMSKLERGDVEKSVTTPKDSPCFLQDLDASGVRSSKDNNPQGRCGGVREVNDPMMPAETNKRERIRSEETVTASEISPCILPRLKTAESETSKEVVFDEVVELNVFKEVNRLKTCEMKHVNMLESAPRASVKTAGTGSSDARISQDGYRETIGHRMPVPTSIEKDGLEISGVVSEFSPQMILKTAGIRNSEDTISEDRYGGFKQNNELRMLAQMSMLERGKLEKSVTTPKCSPCLSQNVEASRLRWSKDIPQGGCAGVREVIDPKMPAETNRPGRIGLEKTVISSEISHCILPRLKTVESETLKEKVSEEAVQVDVSKEVNRSESFERKHVMDVKNPEPDLIISTPSRRRSQVNMQIILEGDFQESRSHQNFASPVKGVLSSAMDVSGSLSQEGWPNTRLSFPPASRRRSYPRRQSASVANSHRRIEISTDLHHPTPSETLATGPKNYISMQQGGGISEGNRPSETNSELLESVPVQAEANSAPRLSTRQSRRRIEPRRVSCPDGEVFRLQKSLSARDVQTSRHTDSSSDDQELITLRTERRRIKRATKPLVWRSRSMQPQDDSD